MSGGMGLPSAQPVRRDVAQSAAGALDPRTMGSLTCDIAFVSDDSMPAEAIVSHYAERVSDPPIASLIWNVFNLLRASYQNGSIVGHTACVSVLIQQALDGSTPLDH